MVCRELKVMREEVSIVFSAKVYPKIATSFRLFMGTHFSMQVNEWCRQCRQVADKIKCSLCGDPQLQNHTLSSSVVL